jgi:hypothetical protein
MVFSRDEFTRDAVQFCDAFQALDVCHDNGPLTKWELTGNEPRNVYVTHSPILCEIPKSVTEEIDKSVEFECEMMVDDTLVVDPDAVQPLMQQHQQQLLVVVQWKFSIVFSDTWRVPVLYFTVQHGDGTPLLRSQVLEIIEVDEKEIADTWDFVSHDEHPITGEPSFFLHPCQTFARLKLLFLQDTETVTSPLISWVTMVLPAVGFRLPTRTFIRVQAGISKQQQLQDPK